MKPGERERADFRHLSYPERTKLSHDCTCKAIICPPPFPPSYSLEEKKLWLAKQRRRNRSLRNRKIRVIPASLTSSSSLGAGPNWEREEIILSQDLSFDYFMGLLVVLPTFFLKSENF